MANQLATISNQLSILDRQISDVTERLAPASDDLISSRLLALSHAGMKFDPAIQNANRAYSFALKGVSAAAFKAVSEKLIQGKIERRGHGFIPVPSELAALCRAEVNGLVEDAARLRATRDTLRLTLDADRISEDERARVSKLIADFRKQREIDKEGQGRDFSTPMDDDEAERARALLALPDAKKITVSQAAYRTAVADRLSMTEGGADDQDHYA